MPTIKPPFTTRNLSRRTFCTSIGLAIATPMLDQVAAPQAPPSGPGPSSPLLPLRSPGLEHLGLTVPDPEVAAKFYGRIFNPQLFREREPPPRYYVTVGTAYLAFGGSTTVSPRVDHFCALVEDYRGREMRPLLEAQGIQLTGPGMISDPDGLRLQLLGVPGGLAGTIVPGGRISLDPPAVHGVGLDHIVLRVTDVQKSAEFYRKFFGKELPSTARERAKKKPERVWFQVANTRLGLEAVTPGGMPAVDHCCFTVAGYQRKTITESLKRLGIELVPPGDEDLIRFRDPNGIVVELTGA